MKRSVRRSRQRGAALVEAALVLPVICTFLGMMIWFHSLYKTKQDMMLKARTTAFTRASHGCQPGNDNPLPSANGAGGGQAAGAAAASGGSGSTNFGFELRTDDETGTARGKGGTTGGWSRSIKAHSAVYCNEIPVDGNLITMFTYGFQQGRNFAGH